ncbi:lysylphosphatidylglycerol synthase transmembrane domain-containing protein [Chitinophaga rhizophila]|uniref:Flippase-like domain-containing protein n=1 Tax=Chitinophaga rhizophila TaxID=2866212 RepID=A0ABS7GG92_9BACT|nr:lysylphosphatidylglycerol synthase transmembrane domain-containing protein [Chitinophaga rhizophila]MBW8686707.1 flippase-like domain-containing protein [Chitinophaga rhizophila]
MPKFLKFICFLAIGLGLVWLVTHNLTDKEKDDIFNSLGRANYWLLIPVIIVGIASHWYRAVRWKLIMQPLGYNPGTLNTFFAVMVGYLANLAVPRLGEVTRCGIVARYEKIPVDKLVGTMIAERAVDMLLLIILMVITVAIQIDVIGGLFLNEIWHPVENKLGAAGSSRSLLLAGIVLGILLLCYIGFRLIARSGIGIKLRALAHGVWDGIRSIGKMEKKGWFIFYSVLIWVMYFAMMYLGFYCMEETRYLGLKAALAVLIIGSVGMIVTPGGTGAYQFLVQRTLMVYGVLDTSAYAFGWIVWSAQTLLVLIVGLASLIALPLMNRTQVQAAKTGTPADAR